MGKINSKIPPAELRDLVVRTHFTEKELKDWYTGFRRDCPDGRLTLDQFSKIYSDFYGNCEARKFAEHLFRTFDVNQDGRIGEAFLGFHFSCHCYRIFSLLSL